MAMLLYSLTNGDTYWIDPNHPGPLLTSVYVNNIGQPRHFVGSHTNSFAGVTYALDPISSSLLANNLPVAQLTYRGRPFTLDFFTFGFTIDPDGNAFYLGRHGDSNQDCLYSINLANAQMSFIGCLDMGNPIAAVNGLVSWNGFGLPIWEGTHDQ